MTAFVIEKGVDGFSSGKKEDKLGMRASETAELIFDNCIVHESNILGNVGDGFIQALRKFLTEEEFLLSLSLGIAKKEPYQTALQYSKRKRTIWKVNIISTSAFKLA